MRPDAAQQQPGGAGPPPDAGAHKAAPSASGSKKRDAADGGKKKPPADASEKLTKTATFCPSVEQQSQIAAEDKQRGAPAAKGIVATLLSFNPLAFVGRPRATRVDSLEVIRKRIQEKEEPPAPFPLEMVLGTCLTVFLVVVLVAYLAIGISEHETTTASAPRRPGGPGFDPAFNDTSDDVDLSLLDTGTDEAVELEQLSLPLPKKDVNGSGPATDAEVDAEVDSAGLANGSVIAPF